MKISTITNIGLDVETSQELSNGLNELLANFQVYKQNLQGLHWNIRGKSFFELHLKFEELYTDANEKIDIIAERVLTLGGIPLHNFVAYIEHSSVPVGKNVSNDVEAVQLVVNSITQILLLERNLLELSDEGQDEGTNSLMSDLISEQEKTMWMFKAWLN